MGEIYSLIEIIVGLFVKTLALSPSHYFLDVDHKDINTLFKGQGFSDIF